MGMYTGLRFLVKIKPEYSEMIRQIESQEKEWEDFQESYPFVNSHTEHSRSGFIPHGALCYMPSEWKEDKTYYDAETRMWSCSSSSKSYSMTIDFVEKILPVIAESSEYVHVLYEEYDEPKSFVISNDSSIEIIRKEESEDGLYRQKAD